MPPPEARRVDRRYRKMLRDFRRDGIDWVPDAGRRRHLGRAAPHPHARPVPGHDAMSTAPESFPEPIFVGGVGRSGTHAMGRLVASHPRYHRIRTEVRFHASPNGLPDLLAGKVDLDTFLKRMRGYWWKRGWGQGQGLQRICDRETFDAALRDFERDFEHEPWEASRRLMRALLDPAAAADGKPAWVEVTGAGDRAGVGPAANVPAREVHQHGPRRARGGGRHAPQGRHDRRPDEGARQVGAHGAGIGRRDALRARGDAFLTVHLDDLAARDREGTYRRVVEFLEVEDDSSMRAYFDKQDLGRARPRRAVARPDGAAGRPPGGPPLPAARAEPAQRGDRVGADARRRRHPPGTAPHPARDTTVDSGVTPTDSFPGPILIGGSARSGTHAMGRLLDAHPRYHLIGTEARFHSSPNGLPDLLAGEGSMERFLELCRGHWWRRGFKNGAA